MRVQFILIVFGCSYAGQDIQLLVKTPLIIHQSAYTTHHTPLVIHHSSYTTQHTPLIIHHLSYTPHHTRLIIHSLRVQDRFYIQIRIPFSPMCDMQGLPPLKNATVGCVSMWTASLASRGGRMCVISRRGHTHLTHVESRGSEVRSACV